MTYPYLCDSLWSIIVTTSRMISRRRSASLSLPLPRISWWRIIRTIMKISTLFHPLALSLSFTSRLCSFSVFVFHAFWIVFKGTCIVNYKYRQRDAVAPSSRLFFHHIVVVVAVARRFSFCSFLCFFFPFLLKFWTELSESVHAAVSACIERRENESNILKEYNEGRISAVRSISIPNILFLFYSMRNNYIHLNPN